MSFVTKPRDVCSSSHVMIKSRPNMFLRFAEKPCHMHRLQQRFLQEGVVVAPQARLSCAAGATWAVKNQWSRKALVFNAKFIAACTLAGSTYHPDAGVHSELRQKRHQNQSKNSRKSMENRTIAQMACNLPGARVAAVRFCWCTPASSHRRGRLF